VAADFSGAIKGLRSIDSMQDALDTTLAGAKIAADCQARGIRANVSKFKDQSAGLEHLFPDLAQMVHKAADDFAALLQSRIATHKAAEAAREAQRKADEESRIAAEVKRRADAAAAAQAQQQAQAALQVAAAPVPTPAPQPQPAPALLLQDESRGLSDALASKPDAMLHAREAAAAIQQPTPLTELQALAAEARASRFPSQPKMGAEWWARFYAMADAT
jgi:hypothetical protein